MRQSLRRSLRRPLRRSLRGVESALTLLGLNPVLLWRAGTEAAYETYDDLAETGDSVVALSSATLDLETLGWNTTPQALTTTETPGDSATTVSDLQYYDASDISGSPLIYLPETGTSLAVVIVANASGTTLDFRHNDGSTYPVVTSADISGVTRTVYEFSFSGGTWTLDDSYDVFFLTGFYQDTATLQPLLNADGSVAFDGTDDKFEITPFPASGTFSGTMVVGTSLGTFAYDVTYGAGDLSEIELLGEAAGYPQDGELVAFGLFPQLTQAEVDFVRGQFIALGAATTASNILRFFWRFRDDLTSFYPADTSNTFLFRDAWQYCSSLISFSFINVNLGVNFSLAWFNCNSLVDFPANLFDTWNPDVIASGVFDNTWAGCTSLTPQSVENILVSIDTSGQYATSNGTSTGTALADAGIDIDYDGTGLTDATLSAIGNLSAKGWEVYINGTLMDLSYLTSEILWTADDTNTVYKNATDLAAAGDSVYKIVDRDGLELTQTTATFQPVLNANGSLAFDSADDRFALASYPASSFSGTMVVGTSLGTFAYDVEYGAGQLSEIDILGEVNGEYQSGNLVAFGLFPQLTQAEIDFVRGQFVALGATESPSGSMDLFFIDRDDITDFKLVDTSSVSQFVATWFSCTSLTSFPLIDTSSATDFFQAFRSCTSLTSFPAINTSNATSFNTMFQSCSSLTSFPLLQITNVETFRAAWNACVSLSDFPAGFFDSWNPTKLLSQVFNNTWSNCNLTQQSVENILVSIDRSGQWGTSDGTSTGTALADPVIDIDSDGSALTTAAQLAITSLKSKGWGINYNGVLQ